MQGLTVAVRGTGSSGLRHLRVLRDRLGVHAVALPVRADRRPALEALGFATAESAAAVAAQAPAFCSIVATDTARHLDDATELLAYGDVLIEKPLAPTNAGVEAFCHRAARSARRVAVGYCLRFNRSLGYARRRLSELGTIHSVRIESQSFLPEWRPERDYRRSYSARAEEGGVLRDLAHELDYAVWLFGMPSAVCCSTATGRLGIDAEETADVLWHAGSATVSIHLDYVTRPPRRRFVACGSGGTLEWDGVEQRVTLRSPSGASDTQQLPGSRDDEFEAQAAAFVGGRHGEPLSDLESAARIVAITDAAHASARERRWQPIAVSVAA